MLETRLTPTRPAAACPTTATALLPLFLAFSSAAAAAPPGTEVAVRQISPGAVAARVTIAGATVWMLVDSGATRSRISAALARRLALRPTARHVLAGLDGIERSAVCHGPIALGVGGLELSVDCLSWSDELAVPLGLDGVLGADALAAADVLLDTAAARLRVAPAGTLASWVDGSPIPARLLGGRPAVAVDWAVDRTDGATGPGGYLVLDSGADAPILFGELARSLIGHRESKRRLEVQTAGRAVEAWTTRLPWLKVGSRKLPWLAAVLLPEVVDRAELGLLPPSLLGPTLLALHDGVVVEGARLRRSPRADSHRLVATNSVAIRLVPTALGDGVRLPRRPVSVAEGATTPRGGARPGSEP
jgi:predicted aspartyl protease